MAAFIRSVPSLVSHAHPTVPLPAFRAAFAAAHPAPSTSRLFSSTARNAFHPKQHNTQHSQPGSLFDALRASFRPQQGGGAGAGAAQKRGIATGGAYGSSSGAYGGAQKKIDWSRVGVNVGIGAAGAVGLNLLLNSETKPLEAHEWQYLRDTMKWTGVGLAITAGTAFAAFKNGVTYRMMAMNPWAVAGISLVAGIGSMMLVFNTAPDTPAHYAAWALFSATQGMTLSPLFFIAPAVLGRAGLYTLGATAGISYVGSTAKSDQYLWIGGPLLAGLGVLIATSLAPLVLPATTSLRTLTMLESVGAYGGVAVFSGMILYRTNQVRHHANLAARGAIPRDPVRESVGIILSVINLFTSIVRVLLLQQGNRRR
ncbi:hypothetical protein JCM10908_003611 [Rhodotorula pacifica]|uniref:uncharacterized protein n=1 Tax=Rhodotorula pacifica TaxID=1495444 RepID=UPI003176A261